MVIIFKIFLDIVNVLMEGNVIKIVWKILRVIINVLYIFIFLYNCEKYYLFNNVV